MTTHRLDPTQETTRDTFSRDHAPALSIDETGAVSGSVPRALAGDTAVRFVVELPIR